MNSLPIFAVGLFVGILIALLFVFGMKVSQDSIENIEARFDADDARRLAFLDDNHLDSVYNAATGQWGIVTQGRVFLASGPTLHEAISIAESAFARIPA